MFFFSRHTFTIRIFYVLGPRQSGENYGVESQRQLDGNGRPRWLRKILAVQHEQRQGVPGAQRSAPRHKVSTTSLHFAQTCIFIESRCFG